MNGVGIIKLNINKIKELSVEKDMSYTEIATKSDISLTHLSRLMNNKSNKRPQNKTVKSLAACLGVDYKEILEEI